MSLTSIIREDFALLTRNVAALVLVFLTPLAILLIAPAEHSEHAVRVLVAGSSSEAGVTDRLIQVMGESSQIDVVTPVRDAVGDPLKTLKDDRLDILLNYEKYQHDEVRLTLYTAETDPSRLAELEHLAAGILRVEAFISQRLASSVKRLPQPLFSANVWWARPALYEDLYMLGALPIQPLTEYFPQAADPRVTMFPTLIILLSSILPFALAIATTTHHHNDVTAKWRSAATQTAAHAVLPASITVLATVAAFLLAEFVLDVHLKAGVFRMILLMLPLLLSAAFTGLTAVSISRTRMELAAYCSLYILLVVMLTSGIPIIERHAWVHTVAWALPATHLEPVLAAWLFGAPFDARVFSTASWMLGLALFFWQVAALAQLWQSWRARMPNLSPIVLSSASSLDTSNIRTGSGAEARGSAVLLSPP